MSSNPTLSRIKGYVVCLRIKELNECLEKLGLKKQGRKADLAKRLSDYLEEASIPADRPGGNTSTLNVAMRVVEDVYNRMITEGGGRAMLYAHQYSPPTGNPNSNSASPTPPRYNPAPQPPAPPPQPPPPPHQQARHHQPTSSHHNHHHHHQTQANLRGYFSTIPGSRAGAGNTAGTSNSSKPVSNGIHHPTSAYPQGGNRLGSHQGIPGLGPGGHASPSKFTGKLASGTLRCVCGGTMPRGELVACHRCNIVQHADCIPLSKDVHYCERCRAELCDPFWSPVEWGLLPPAKLLPTGRMNMVGTKMEPMLAMEKPFSLSSAQYDLIKKQAAMYRLHLTCLQFQDSVMFRFHWPTGCDLRVNGMQYRVYGRSMQQKMGANQRDEPANIGVLCHMGKPNKISITATDPGQYLVVLQIVKARSMSEVKALMTPPETLEQATARIRKQLGGSGDDELLVTQTRVPLRCPLSGARIQTPARFTDVPGMSCFDLDSFLSMAQKSRKWQCPHSMKNSNIQNLQIDTYLNSILESLKLCPDVSEVEIDPEARWRPVGTVGAQDWHSPGDKPYSNPGALQIKTEPGLEEDDSSEEDEKEELRKAVEAVKRGQPSVDVIELLDSDDDVGPVGRPAKRQQLDNGNRSTNGNVHGHAPPPPPPSNPSRTQVTLVQHSTHAQAAAAGAGTAGGTGKPAAQEASSGLRFRIQVPQTYGSPGTQHHQQQQQQYPQPHQNSVQNSALTPLQLVPPPPPTAGLGHSALGVQFHQGAQGPTFHVNVLPRDRFVGQPAPPGLTDSPPLYHDAAAHVSLHSSRPQHPEQTANGHHHPNVQAQHVTHRNVRPFSAKPAAKAPTPQVDVIDLLDSD